MAYLLINKIMESNWLSLIAIVLFYFFGTKNERKKFIENRRAIDYSA